MNYAEEQEGIADSTISQKITHLQEVLKKRLDEEKKHKDTTDERKTQIDGQLELLAKHQAYLTSLQEALQKQYEDLGNEVEKYKGQRKAGTAALSGGCTEDPLSHSHKTLFRHR
jgi:flagellar capping protein FliD